MSVVYRDDFDHCRSFQIFWCTRCETVQILLFDEHDRAFAAARIGIDQIEDVIGGLRDATSELIKAMYGEGPKVGN